jgi:hypothetical protein
MLRKHIHFGRVGDGKMGYITEFNWALKLKPEQGLHENSLEVGMIYDFSKEENRIYPLDIPIDLINENWEAVAKVVITQLENKKGKTSGKFKVLRIYKGTEKDILTNYWRENIQIIKGKKISNFSKVKVT